MRHFSPIQFRTVEQTKVRASAAPAAARGWASPHAGRSRVVVSLVVCGIVLIAAIVSACATLMVNLRDRQLADTERELANTAYILSGQCDRAFQALELIQRSTIERMQTLGLGTRDDLRHRMSTYDMHLMLRDKISGLPQMESLAVFDSAGNLVNFSRLWPIPALNVVERDFFKALSSDRQLVSFLGEPVLNRTTGTWSIYLARKFIDVDGELLGFVLVGMQLTHFEETFASIALGEGSAISLFRNDGTLLARHPHVKGAIGVPANRVPFDRATARLISSIDGQERIVSRHRLPSYPVVVSVSTTTSAALVQWRQEAKFLGAAGSLSAFVIAAVVVIIVRQLLQGQKQTQRILDAQTFKLNTALDNMSQGLCMFDSSARLVLCNQRYLQMYGLSPEIVRPGVPLRELVEHRREMGTFQDDPERYCSEILATVAGGTRNSRSVELPDGRTIRLLDQPMDNGWWVSTHEDITEQRRAEKELERTKSFLDTVIENVPVTIFVKDPQDFRYLLINRAGEGYHGIPRDQMIGKSADDIFAKPVADLINAHDRELVETGREMFFPEHEITTPGNGTRIITTKRLPIFDEKGKPQYLLGVIEDITERRQAERERDRNRDFLDLIIENVPATIWVKDARDGRYVLINRAAEQLWGMNRADVIGKTTAEIFSPEQAEVITQRDQQLLRSDQHLIFDEHPVNTPGNGTKIVTSKRIAIRQNGENQYLLGVAEDVSGRKMIERQLQQAQKMEAVGNLTGGLAHDFNNLLLIIIGNLDLLQVDVVGNTAAEEKIETMLEASLRGAELTRQMLAFSRRQTLQPKRLDVNALIGNTMRLLTRTLGETITYDLRLAGDLWPVYVDEAQLESAMVNIAINARDAMPEGGTLSIATVNAHIDADLAARYAEFTPGDYVMIEITDTGTGMPAEVAARIFEPFFTTKGPGKGTGLGLSMVYGFLKQSKGHITTYSEIGLGTSFKMYLPRDATGGAQTKPQAAAEGANARANDGESILVVDDNPDVRAAVCTQLKGLGYEVHQADGGHSALERLESLRVDLLFTDVVMPGGMSGKDLAQKARVKFPDLKVLFTSGFPGKSFADGKELETGDRLLSKPYRKADLAAAVRGVLDQRAPL